MLGQTNNKTASAGLRRTRYTKKAHSSGRFNTHVLTVCSLFWVTLLATIATSSAQEEICACSPSTFEFTFNFGLRCPRQGEDVGSGISEVTCFTTGYSSGLEDINPVVVRSISIIESDVNRVPIAQTSVEGDFENGSTFTYSSISSLGEDSIPQSIQLTITAANVLGSPLVQVWAIKYSNDCETYPVLEIGESFGWTEFSDLGTPRSQVCPSAPFTPTLAPTQDSNVVLPEEPTAEPTTEPTAEPTASPVVTNPPKNGKKTPSPTSVSTEPPTALPTVAPTKSPKGGKMPTPPAATSAPTALPTLEPPVTEAPVEPPSISSPTIDDSVEENPTISGSFSYEFTFDEDYDFEMEWGRSGSGKKKDKKTPNDDSRDESAKVRIGQRNRYKR